MDNSVISSYAKMADSPEESSWTFYIQCFMCENDDQITSNFSSDYESPSLVSDAASSAVKKLANILTVGMGFSSGKVCNQNSLKKQKTVVLASLDYDLEDTTSSPVNSPKICCVNSFIKQREDGKMDVSEVKSSKRGLFTTESDTDCINLKKRSYNQWDCSCIGRIN